jgi:hypothetical protein
MSNDYAALLKSAKDIPVLSTGIDNTVANTREHLSHEGTFFFTQPYGQNGKYTVNKHLECSVH